ncbi:hypothetical protein LXJ56_28650, partial [Escherichia coli]|nr:hypothetical protein [Escherichia coli]
RNTTAVRSNYLLTENQHFYEASMKLWETMSHDLNYNVMFSQRGVVNLAHIFRSSMSMSDAATRCGSTASTAN